MIDRLQRRLLILAALFLTLYALALSLSPAVRARSWEVAYRWDHWLGLLVWLVSVYLAHVQTSRWLPQRDPYLLALGALLSGWGILTIWRLLPAFGLRQSLWIAVAITVLVLGLRLPGDLGFLRRYKYLWLTGSLLLTALTLFLGVNPMGYGPRMWLGCCGIYLQPSEPLKLLLIAYLAAYMADRQPYFPPLGGSRAMPQAGGAFEPSSQHADARAGLPPGSSSSPSPSLSLSTSSVLSRTPAPLLPLLAPTMIMTGLALVLLVVQRDLGTASVFLFLYAAMLYFTFGRVRVLLVGALALALAGAVGYWAFDVVRIRVDAWLNPWLDPSGRSYQIVQSLLAVANGGFLGRGPGVGNPGLVPISHSDLIYAAISEEAGLFGALGLILVIAILTARGLRTALFAADPYQRYLAAGLTAYLAGQSVLIIAGNLRLLPLTGITLPFISYGGSSLLVSFISLLLLLHISNHGKKVGVRPSSSQPYLILGGILFTGLAATALATGWWTVVRSPGLLARTDNGRRSIADRSVRRGSILDRENRAVSASYGAPGELYRQILSPDLSNIIGYTHPIYGQSGLEASQDGYLRGERGNPILSVWWNSLLFGQPPPGLDLRLSLDLDLQQNVARALDEKRGALVLLNAQSGEILAMSAHPSFDANHIEEHWDQLVADPHSPLLNRATLGRYPTAGFLERLFNDGTPTDWLTDTPQIRLPTGDDEDAGQVGLYLSPLQASLAAASISGQGVRPAPSLVRAVNSPTVGWIVLPELGQASQVMRLEAAAEISSRLAGEGLDIWEVATRVEDPSGQVVVWYLGGTLPDWPGQPLALALALEGGDLESAAEIGRQALDAAMFPE